MLSCLIGILPSLLVCLIIILLCKKLILKDLIIMTILFILGAIGTYVTYRFEMHFGGYFPKIHHGEYLRSLFYALFGVAIFEEGYKWFVSSICSIKENNRLKIILYCVVCAAGFAISENIFIYLPKGDLNTMVIRSFTAVPSHLSCGIIMGYFLGKFKNKKNIIYLFLGLIVPMICHALYNFTLYKGVRNTPIIAYTFLVLFCIISVIICIRLKMKKE